MRKNFGDGFLDLGHYFDFFHFPPCDRDCSMLPFLIVSHALSWRGLICRKMLDWKFLLPIMIELDPAFDVEFALVLQVFLDPGLLFQ